MATRPNLGELLFAVLNKEAAKGSSAVLAALQDLDIMTWNHEQLRFKFWDCSVTAEALELAIRKHMNK